MPEKPLGLPFDPKRKFGTVIPPWHGAVVEQVGPDGVSRLYDGSRSRVFPPGEELSDEELAAEIPKTPPKQKKPRSKTNGRGPKNQPKDHPVEANKMIDVDLAAWAKGEEQMPFSEVAAAIKESLGEDVEDEIAAAVALTNAGIVKAGEIAVL